MAIDDPLRERIEVVLRTLPLRRDLSAAELESRIAVAAGELTRQAKITLSFLPDPGAPALDKQATEALQKLACSLDTAIHTLAFLLPEPAAVALVDAGLVPEKAQQALEAMLKSIDGAYLSFAPKKPGRPPDTHLRILVDSLGATYFDLTGKRPTVSTMNSKASGIFYNFTLKMLQAMRLEKIFKPEYEVRRLCQVWRKRRPSAAI